MAISLSSTFEELVKEINKKANAGESGGTDVGGDEMPTIRLATVRDTNGSMVISADNPLTITVEITSGALQVGDQLQLCARKLYTYQTETGRERRYKLRAIMNYEISESDLTRKYLMLHIGEDWAIKELCRGGGQNSPSRRYPKYIRIRRGYMREDGSTEGAKFSNEVQFECYGRYDGENHATDGRISIR